jgi:hypothetical protein
LPSRRRNLFAALIQTPREGDVRSAGGSGVTIVMIITLIFTAFSGSSGQTNLQLTGVNVETRIEQCVAGQPCPTFQLTVRQVIVPATITRSTSLSPIECATLSSSQLRALPTQMRAACA